jgi:hypothetical protein
VVEYAWIVVLGSRLRTRACRSSSIDCELKVLLEP